jgi:hypothetical protein
MMIVTFRESLDRVVPAGFRQKQVNDAVRSGLILAADYLIEVNLRQRKFATGNRSRYGFAARNRSYENRKRAAEFVRDPDTGLKVRKSTGRSRPRLRIASVFESRSKFPAEPRAARTCGPSSTRN